MREQTIFRVDLVQLRRAVGILAIRRGHDHEPQQFFHVPMISDKFRGEPIEQLTMARPIRLITKILGSFYDARAEETLPKTIHDYARGEWIARIGEPMRKLQARARRALAECGEKFGNAGLNLFARLIVNTTR